MVAIEQVSFGYGGVPATLENINLHISPGECVLLCGESGCGKTTLTKLINGLIPHFTDNCKLSGKVVVENMDVAATEMYILSKKIGSVFQNPKSQFFNLDSDSELAFGLENAGVEPEKISIAIKKTIEELNIQKLLGRNIFAMSGGEKQTLAFASTYSMNPSVFVLDEPTANLDAASIECLAERIRKIKAEGHSVIIAEHRLYFLTDIIDRAVFLKKGKIIQSFSREEFSALTEEQRISMGLRSFKHNKCILPAADLPGTSTGLSVENLTCNYRNKTIFKNMGFSAEPGEIIGIIGDNGVGKTTLVRCLCGLLKPSSGTVRLKGKVLSKKKRIEKTFCVMQDVNHQLFSDSVWNECLLSDPECPGEKINETLTAFKLDEFKERHPMSLSGGQKQRLAIASAVLTNKAVMVFDEPTSGLDYIQMMDVKRMIKKLSEKGHIIIIVTHDMEFLQQVCEKIVHMN